MKIDNLQAPKDDPRLQTFLDSLRAKIGEDERYDPLAPWLYREFKKNRLDHGLGELAEPGAHLIDSLRPKVYNEQLSEEHGSPQFDLGDEIDLGHWVDWYGSNSPTRRGVDIMGLKDPQMVADLVGQWDDELAAKMEEEAKKRQDAAQESGGMADDGTRIQHQFPDGWSIRQLMEQKHCTDEGNALGHCIQSYPPSAGLYSLRDPDNNPHVSFEATPGDDTEVDDQGIPLSPANSKIVQIQGKQNEAPIDKYKEMLKDYFSNAFDDDNRPFVNVRTKTLPNPKNIDDLRSWVNPDQTLPDDGGAYSLGSRDARDLYGINVKGKPWEKPSDPPDWNPLVKYLMQGKGEEAEEVFRHLESLGELDRFRSALEGNLEGLTTRFYMDAYNPDLDRFNEDPSILDDVKSQWSNWYIPKTFYPNLPLLRNPAVEALHEVGDDGTLQGFERDPDTGLIIAPPQHPGQMSLFPPEATKTSAMKPVYFRWSFSPRTGVSLGDNERDLDAFVNYRAGSGDKDEANGYAYRIGNGWRLTDNEHRAVEDPYVVAQVVKKLQGFEEPVREPRPQRVIKDETPMWSAA